MDEEVAGDVPIETQRLLVGAYLLHVICEANGGQPPKTIWQYRRAGRRFGVRIRFLPAGCEERAFLRAGGRAGEYGVIYVRRTRNMARLRLDLLHELGEVAGRWEGVPPVVTRVTRHDAACIVVRM